MLSNEKFALECRDRYAEDGLVVDQSNGEFAHCPLPKGLGEKGYYLLHDDHQWQGLLQSKDLGKRCFWTPDTKKWLSEANFVEGYFDLWNIYEEFISGKHNSEETRRKQSEAKKGEKNHFYGKKQPDFSERLRKRTGELHPNFGKRWWNDGCGNTQIARDCPGDGWKLGRTGEFHPASGRRWWNDGKGNTKFMEECPGDGWKLGRK